MTKHMGVNLRGSETDLFLTKENYLMVTKKNSFDNPTYEYSDEWCEQHKANCYLNYDLNMKYFASLDHRDFDKEVMKYVKKQKFTQCMDLNYVNEVEGIYMMILDRYSQAYVGTSGNIKRRIMSHWTKKMPFDRLLFPMNGISTSKISINSFRALDTTRVYFFLCYSARFEEYTMVNNFPNKYLCNRISGGSLMDIAMNEVFVTPREYKL